MSEAGRRLALFAGGLAAVFGLGLLLGATIGPDAGDPGDGGHATDHQTEHPADTTTVPGPPPPPEPAP